MLTYAIFYAALSSYSEYQATIYLFVSSNVSVVELLPSVSEVRVWVLTHTRMFFFIYLFIKTDYVYQLLYIRQGYVCVYLCLVISPERIDRLHNGLKRVSECRPYTVQTVHSIRATDRSDNKHFDHLIKNYKK